MLLYSAVQRLQADLHILGIPVVGISALKCGAGAIHSNQNQRSCGALRDPAGSKSAHVHAIKCVRNAQRQREARLHLEAVDASSTCDTAGQKPGHVVVRHFRDCLCAAAVQWPSPRHLSLRERLAMRVSGGAMTRQIARRFGRRRPHKSANARQPSGRIGVTAAQQRRS